MRTTPTVATITRLTVPLLTAAPALLFLLAAATPTAAQSPAPASTPAITPITPTPPPATTAPPGPLPSATPSPRFVALADDLLGRRGRMVDAIRAIGRGAEAMEGTPFMLQLSSR